ncbi:MAG: T9SS C-terminal target domain-containing protein [Cytophagales bacterium]|nr:MAG: T9SS C-terminal target domain-containing protein [Cytophagales bacterium]
MLFKSFLFNISYLFFLSFATAQISITPNWGFQQENNNIVKKANNTKKQIQSTLSLPFFDDFSTSQNTPSATLWEANGGTYLSNTIALNSISTNVVVFDGIAANGNPYDVTNSLAKGLTDQLTSLPINLAGMSNASNIFMSFYWQPEGLGELPDTDDSLRLQFKDLNNNWITVWKTQGGTPNTQFRQQIIAIQQNIYLHAQFQFRFQSFGRQSGIYDHWLLDYVYINQNRNIGDAFIRDIACTDAPTSLLKKYTAMPIEQFLTNPTAFLNNSVTMRFNNLNSIFNVISFNATLEELAQGSSLGTILTGSQLINGGERGILLTANINAAAIPLTNQPKILRYKFNINTGDNNTTIPPIDLRLNDTISRITYLQDYFAYDDGSAEYALALNQRFARAAYRFIAPQADTLTEIAINFARIEKNLTGESFVLAVWKTLTPTNEGALFAKSFSFTYPTNKDGFIRFKLDVPVVVKDTFYIGWQQTSNNKLGVGFDKNTNSNTEIFYSIDRVWIPLDSNEKGSLLLRPIFGSTVLPPITALDNDPTLQNTSQWLAMPNPTEDEICLQNTQENAPSIALLHLYDTQGKLLLQSSTPCIYLKNYPTGIYILRLTDSEGKITVLRVQKK